MGGGYLKYMLISYKLILKLLELCANDVALLTMLWLYKKCLNCVLFNKNFNIFQTCFYSARNLFSLEGPRHVFIDINCFNFISLAIGGM